MDPRIQAGIIAFAAAIIATAIGGAINYKIDSYKNKRSKREETLKNLYLLKTKLSFHKIDMHSGSDSVNSFNENYDEANILIAEITMSLSLYFKNHEKSFSPVLSEAAYYWKSYKDYITSEKRNPQGEDSPFQRALQASMACQEIIEKLMHQMKSEENA